MQRSGFTRAGAIAMLFSIATLFTAPAFASTRNAAAEQHVLTNANAALDALSNDAVPAPAREQAFRAVIARMADVRSISTFVLGRYGASVRGDAALQAQWTQAFGNYVYAVYQDNLLRHAGGQLQIAGSVERVAGRDVIVKSQTPSRTNGRPLMLQWRVLRGESGWRVVDVSFVAEGSEVWLAQQQRNEFTAQLDQNRGDVRALIASLQERTRDLRRSSAAGG